MQPEKQPTHTIAPKHAQLSYAERAAVCANSRARDLLLLMHEKQTNLALAADVTTKQELLALVDAVGEHICMLKMHIDIITDFDQDLIHQLRQRAKQYRFLICEDRKFADIGNTSVLQFTCGMYCIASWADLVTVHAIAGAGILQALSPACKEHECGMLLLAHMSSRGALITDAYTQAVVAMAREHATTVAGFIVRDRVSDDASYINCMPGVHLASKGDACGQQYLTPECAVLEHGADVIIVGRGIYQAADPAAMAYTYRQAGFEAYLTTLLY
jgi:orotidine 5'-phosphate decarboxylase subfamily 1